MSKVIFTALLGTAIFAAAPQYNYSTTSVVTIVGASILSSQSTDVVEKYKRKDCPVCKGKGWYISGDGIAKVSCNYCEPEDTGSKQRKTTNPSIKYIYE